MDGQILKQTGFVNNTLGAQSIARAQSVACDHIANNISKENENFEKSFS
jgi:hypothetical protein